MNEQLINLQTVVCMTVRRIKEVRIRSGYKL